MDKIMELVNEQYADEALWITDCSVYEAYVQQELRRLHAVIASQFKAQGVDDE